MGDIGGREIKVIRYLLEKIGPITAFKISDEVGVNINTLRKDLKRIEKFLKENGLVLTTKAKVGIKIDGPKEKIESLRERINILENMYLDKNRKIWYIAWIFLTKEKIPTIEELCDLFAISRPTAVEYINEVKEWLLERGIKIHSRPGVGYHLEGEEEFIRDAMVDVIKNFLGFEYSTTALEFANGKNVHSLTKFFKGFTFDVIREFIEKVQLEIKRNYIPEDYFRIACFVAVTIKRIKRGHSVNFNLDTVNKILKEEVSFVVRNKLQLIEERLELRFSEEEIVYLSSKFIGAKIQDVESIFSVTEKFKKIAEKILFLVNEFFGLQINKESEFVFMLAHHLESTTQKIKMGIKIENPMLEKVKKEYPIVYSVAEEAANILRKELFIQVPDGEIGYIATYIAALIERLKQQSKRKVAVICPMGVATSKLLYYKLINEIPEIEIVQVGSIKEIEKGENQQGVDFIISTVPLPGTKIPYVVVSPFLGKDDKKIIRDMLRAKEKEIEGPLETGILHTELIFPQLSVKSSLEVIQILGSALIRNGFAKEGLINAILSREKKHPTGINMEIPIAIPHAGPEFTIKRGLAIATLKYPVKFREMGNPDHLLDVKIVLIPVLKGEEDDGKAFYKVIEKLRDKKLLEKVMQSTSYQDIKKIIQQSS